MKMGLNLVWRYFYKFIFNIFKNAFRSAYTDRKHTYYKHFYPF